MLESAAAFRHLDAIVATPGVDAVTLGPSDLAQELGVLGTPEQGPVIDEHRERLIAAATRHGKDVAMLVQTLDEAERWIAAGTRIIAYASDVAVLKSSFAAAVDRLRPPNPPR
jgi:2-dehydro-3-deoxyglucarate aldolase/4-hydroxy-2-oxoheptanedioate aldolase